MTTPTYPIDVQISLLDVTKNWDIDIKFDYEADYDLKLDINKDVWVDMDIKIDVDVKDNVADLTATFENVGYGTQLVGSGLVYTDDLKSLVTAEATGIVTGVNATQVDAQAVAIGENTFAELDFNAQTYDFGTTITIVGLSATD